MQRTAPLCAIFASLLSACIVDTSSDPDPNPGTSTDGNCENSYSEELELPTSEVDAVLDAEDMVLDGACPMLCATAEGFGELVGCELLDIPASTSTSTSTSGEPGDTGEPPGDSSSGGEGTGGSDGTGGEGTGGEGTGGEETGGEETGGGTVGSDDAGTTGGIDDVMVTVRCDFSEYVCGIGGRGHEALRSTPARHGSDRLGNWLAAMAHSEAASVTAFLALSDELAAHGAPVDLVQRAHAAAMDEVEHAEAMTRLAQQRGVEVKAPRFDAIEVRDLTTIATENAVEGCVRETWAALEAGYQARNAADPELRQVMTGIAVDETRHAQLSHDLDQWFRTRLGDEALARVDAARQRAVNELLAGVQGSSDPLFRTQAGLPSAAAARQLCEGLRQQLWA